MTIGSQIKKTGVASLDKIGAGGSLFALFGAMAAAPSCCLPLFASVGGALGLSAFSRYGGIITYVTEVFVVLSVLGAIAGWRRHGKWIPVAIAALSAVAIFYSYNVSLSQALLYSGLAGLVVAAVWNTIEGRRCAACAVREIELNSTIACPECGHTRTETMPEDSCRVVYECEACHATLRPKPGDCCVFCSYGSVKCPPIQSGACPC